jgi:VCBS repeat-containing protein
VADTLSVAEGGTVTKLTGEVASVLANDTDVDSGALTAVLVSGVSHGSLTLNSNGTFSYTHDGSETTSDSFTYKANDAALDSNVVTVSITVTAVNDAPLAVADTLSVAEGGTVTKLTGEVASVLANDTDVDSGELTAVLVSGVSHGSLALNSNGTFSYTHDGSETTSDSFTYKANDAALDSNVVTVSIAVTAVNDSPVASDGSFEPTENLLFSRDQASGLATLVSDADGDTLAFTLLTSPLHGGLTMQGDGSFSYLPDTNFNRTDGFSFKANDGTVDSELVTVTLNMQTEFPWHNGILWGDVNDDGRVNAADAMGMVHLVLDSEHAASPADKSARPIQAPFYDMNRDGEISAEDFEFLKDHINRTQSPVGRIRVLPTDTNADLLRQVDVGDDFWLTVSVMDVRTDAKGVFASYVNLHYDKDAVRVTGDPVFVGPYMNSRDFDRTSPGLVNQVGSTAGLNELTADEYLQFRIPVEAQAQGLTSFSVSLVDNSPPHEFLVYGWDDPVADRQVNLGSSSLTIHSSSSGEGEASRDLFVFAASLSLPLPARLSRLSSADGVPTRSPDVARYRQAVDDAMRTVIDPASLVLDHSPVQRVDGLQDGLEELELLDGVLVDLIFAGSDNPAV